MEILRRLKTIIVDQKVTSLRLIANPEAFSIQNLKRTYLLANLYDINVDLTIMNKVIPEGVGDAYFKEWKKAQEKYLVEAEAAFYPLPMKKLRLFRSEVMGLKLLSELGEELFGEDLSVVISTDIGEVRNFIPLPAIAHLIKLDKAKLLNGELHIYFIDERWRKKK